MSLFNLSSDVNSVSQNIRAAIKTKLMELDVCVEDELPDYIMVMIANKKSIKQIHDDLSLFLGNNTEKFTSWLGNLLQRLQSVQADAAPKTEQKNPVSGEESMDTCVSTSHIQPESSSSHVNRSKGKQTQDKVGSTHNLNNSDQDVLALKAEFDEDVFEEELKEDISTRPISKVDDKLQSKNKEAQPRKRKIVRVRPTANLERKRGPMSTVCAVVQKPVIEEPEYDPSNPSIGKVASIVKVTERKSSIPIHRQANKKLLFKAMQDAQESIVEKSKSMKSKNVVKVEPCKISQVTKLDAINVDENPVDDDLRDRMYSEDELDEQEGVNIITGDTDSGRISVHKRIILNSRKPISITRNPRKTSPNQQVHNPSFIITLDGVEKDDLQDQFRKNSHPRVVFPNFGFEEELIEDENEEECVSDGSEEVDEKRARLPERCRFWPACKNAESCEFHHPNANCRLFPSCKYGDKCLYIHPNCKFDAKCTKENCPFTHASKRPAPSSSSCSPTVNPSTTSEVACKFYPDCNKSDCPFKHPISCKWGFNCKRPDCTFSHPAIPAPDKLKWTAKQDSLSMEI